MEMEELTRCGNRAIGVMGGRGGSRGIIGVYRLREGIW